MAKPHSARNSLLPGGISRLSRSAVYKKRALYKRKKVAVKAKKAVTVLTKVKKVGGEKNGGERLLPLVKESRFYPVDDIKKPLKNRKHPKPAKLRSTLTPGTIVILLAGRHKGKVSTCFCIFLHRVKYYVKSTALYSSVTSVFFT